MKQIILFISLILLVIVTNAQLNSWSLSGNSNATSSSKLGTTNGIGLRFFTNNLEKMRIATNGNVGIGTTTPQQILDVNGNLNIAAGSGFYINNERAIHATEANFFAGQHAGDLNADGKFNTGIGPYALSHNVSGNANTASGYGALFSDISGSYNTANGIRALYHNTTGTNNVAQGSYALYKNIEGYANTASGSSALVTNTSGNSNTASGYGSLYANTSGSFNVGTGVYTLFANTQGYFNTASGISALVFNSTGNGNTASGYLALFNNVDGNYNTAIGYFAGFEGAHLSNATAIGANSAITASNQVRIGDNTVTSIGGYVEWTNISDGRVKKNIKENVPGLAFINKLKAVTYNLDLDATSKITESAKANEKYSEPLPTSPQLDGMDIAEGGKINPENNKIPVASAEKLAAIKKKEQVVYTGFVAQEVEKAAKEINYDFSGVDAAKNDKDLYGLRYSEFVVPLVKAVQELSIKNEENDKLISDLQRQIDELKVAVSGKGNRTLMNAASGYLKQNVPNPSNRNTVIGYFLPDNTGRAQIIITDGKGSTLKVYTASKGSGQLNIGSSELPAGNYNYSLYVDSKKIDSKQMIIAK
ncbi:MAG: hypothetical protein ABI416_04515 [Ginsengibacter sp.]